MTALENLLTQLLEFSMETDHTEEEFPTQT